MSSSSSQCFPEEDPRLQQSPLPRFTLGRSQSVFVGATQCQPSLSQTLETQVEEWSKEAGELQAQVAALPLETASQEMVDGRQNVVGARIVRLIEPLRERRRILLASKELHQISHDLEDELVGAGQRWWPDWLQES